MYFKNGRVKVSIALAKGKQAHDKRDDHPAARGRPRDAGRRQGATYGEPDSVQPRRRHRARGRVRDAGDCRRANPRRRPVHEALPRVARAADRLAARRCSRRRARTRSRWRRCCSTSSRATRSSCPSFTFVSTVNAFVLRGARPVFADVRPDTLNLDETPLEAADHAAHAGRSCRCTTPASAARWTRSWRSPTRHGLAVVEDNAHGLFGTYRGRRSARFGALGDAELPRDQERHRAARAARCSINDPRYVERAEIIREKGTNRSRFFRGQVDKYTWVDVGSSYLPSDILAAFLLAQLEAHEQIQAPRRRAVEPLLEALAPARRRPPACGCRSSPSTAGTRAHVLRAAAALEARTRCWRRCARSGSWPCSTTCRCTSPRWDGASAGATGDCPGHRERVRSPGAPAALLPADRRRSGSG